MLNKMKVCCLGYIMTALIGVEAMAAPIVTTTQDGIIVTAKGDANVPVTIMMSDSASNIIGLMQGEFNKDGECMFSFAYPQAVGQYTFLVNSHRYNNSENAYYYQTDETERNSIYQDFLGASDLTYFYTTNEIKLSINMQEGSDYYNLTNKTAVFDYISTNKNTVLDYYGIGEIFNRAVAIAKEKEYQDSLDKVAIDALNNAVISDKKGIIETYNNRFGFDLTYELGYKKLTGQAYTTQFNKVMESLTDLPYDMTKVKEIFDKNILLQSFDVSTAKEAENLISHYTAFFVDLSTTNYGRLHDIDRTTVLNTVLAMKPYSDISVLINNLKTEIGKIVITDGEGENGGGNGGSGGGGFGGASVVLGNLPMESRKAFEDIDSVSWAKDAIEKLYELGIVNGTGDNNFSPNDYVTREQFVKMLMGVIGESAANGNGGFADVDASQWYSGYVAKAYELAIVKGDSNGNFGVGQNITREDLAVLIYRASQLKNIAFDEGKSTEFTDFGRISDYAKEAVKELTGAGIINGFEDNTFRSKDPATRAQAAKLLYSVYELLGGAV